MLRVSSSTMRADSGVASGLMRRSKPSSALINTGTCSEKNLVISGSMATTFADVRKSKCGVKDENTGHQTFGYLK